MTTGETEKLFVYGIFLEGINRAWFGMTNAEYDTVPNFATVGIGSVNSTIVQAIPLDGFVLTGLVVDMSPYINLGDETQNNWYMLDKLESGYDRIKVKTNSGVDAWMYVKKGITL